MTVEQKTDRSGSRNQEAVVLVHGLAANRLVMWRIAQRLRKLGYHVKNYGYFSIARTIPDHANRLSKELIKFEEDPNTEQVHLVTHSMGCIIGRHLFNEQRFEKLGRWVMLAPPNGGSHAATFLSPYLERLCPPLPQLSDAPDSFVNQIADFRKINDIDFAIVEAAYDRVIDSSHVPLEGQSEYTVVKSHHGLLPWHPEAVEFVEQFLTK